jgi:hypothetical protein
MHARMQTAAARVRGRHWGRHTRHSLICVLVRVCLYVCLHVCACMWGIAADTCGILRHSHLAAFSSDYTTCSLTIEYVLLL